MKYKIAVIGYTGVNAKSRPVWGIYDKEKNDFVRDKEGNAIRVNIDDVIKYFRMKERED